MSNGEFPDRGLIAMAQMRNFVGRRVGQDMDRATGVAGLGTC